MNKPLQTAMIVIATFAAGSAAMAADHSPMVIKSPSDTFTPVEYGSGWYLRGDLGYSFATDGDVTNSNTGVTAGGDFDDQASISLGFGQTFNDVFRADVTWDYLIDRAFSVSGANGSAEVQNLGVNAYVSLGRFGAFSPYVGGGIGAAHVELTDLSGGGQTFANTTEWAMSYSLMAGVDYRIDENWTADLGYRYMAVADDVSAAGSTSGRMTVDDLEFHEVRVGLRYDLW